MEYDQIHTEMEDVSKKQDIASGDLEQAKRILKKQRQNMHRLKKCWKSIVRV